MTVDADLRAAAFHIRIDAPARRPHTSWRRGGYDQSSKGSDLKGHPRPWSRMEPAPGRPAEAFIPAAALRSSAGDVVIA